MAHLTTAEIHIRDPYVLPVPAEHTYYLFGTRGQEAWSGPAVGFDCYRSTDLVTWDGPHPAFRPPAGFWATTQFWAPEVHPWRGRYYLFASFKAPRRYRGTQILVADHPAGPYLPLTDGPATPPDWECLDGTLYISPDQRPWIVFCHEWVQIHNGAICALPLSDDLTRPVGRPVLLFHASEAPWVTRPQWPDDTAPRPFPTYVTDGPFMYRTHDGTLLMLWSGYGAKGYAQGIARSLSGDITGPWTQDPVPLWAEDGGHGMVFTDFGGQLWLTLHQPNDAPRERPAFHRITDLGSTVRLADTAP